MRKVVAEPSSANEIRNTRYEGGPRPWFAEAQACLSMHSVRVEEGQVRTGNVLGVWASRKTGGQTIFCFCNTRGFIG